MARLIVEARTSEWTSGGDVEGRLLLGVSVSRADDGKPVTGLKPENFRVASHWGSTQDFFVSEAREWMWEPANTEPSGCYGLEIMMTSFAEFEQGTRYVFGVEARTFSCESPPNVVDQGQTILELISLGH